MYKNIFGREQQKSVSYSFTFRNYKYKMYRKYKFYETNSEKLNETKTRIDSYRKKTPQFNLK